MRALLLSFGLAAGCSFPYEDLVRVDASASDATVFDAALPDAPPGPDVPVVGCHAVLDTDCMPGHCAADVSRSGMVEAVCRPAGSANAGVYCRDRSFCGNGLACWEDRTGAEAHVCWELCFTTDDCRPGYHCDATTSLTATYLGRPAFPCLPD
jgi:hypothetical protein